MIRLIRFEGSLWILLFSIFLGGQLPVLAMEAGSKTERCIDVFADQARLRKSRNSDLGRKWVASKAGELVFSMNSALIDDGRGLNSKLAAKLEKYAHEKSRKQPVIRLETSSASVLLRYVDEMAAWQIVSRSGYQFEAFDLYFLFLNSRAFVIVNEPSWEGWGKKNRISIYQWSADRFVYVDSVIKFVRLACRGWCGGELSPFNMSYLDVWALNRTGHIFVTNMAARMTMVFDSNGEYWGRLLVGMRSVVSRKPYDAAIESFPKLCYGGTGLTVRGGMLARVVDDVYPEEMDSVVIE